MLVYAEYKHTSTYKANTSRQKGYMHLQTRKFGWKQDGNANYPNLPDPD